MNPLDNAGTFTLGNRTMRRLGYGAMQLAGLIDDLARDGIAWVPFFPLGGFTPLQSAALTGVAQALGATPMQVALAWLLQRAPNVLPIPGTLSVAHLRENLAAAQLVLPPDALDRLERMVPAHAPA